MTRKAASLLALALNLLILGVNSSAQTATDESLAHAKQTYSQQGARAALPEFERVLESYKQGGDRHGEAVTVGLIGNCYKRLGDYPKALSLLSEALALKRELHDRLEEGKTLSHLGLVFWEQGDYPKAIDSLNQSIAIAKEQKDPQLEGAGLNNLSLVYDELGDYRRSLEQYQHAVELHRSVKYEAGESDALGNIGGVYLLLGRYSEAERYYRQALAISRNAGLKPSEAQDLGNLAQCLLGQGKIGESLATYDEAIAQARVSGLAKEEADWHRGKGSALLRVGQFDSAMENYEQASRIYEKAGLKREYIEVTSDQGNAYLLLGDRVSAAKNFDHAASLSKAIGHQRGVVWNQLSLAETLLHSADYVRSRKVAEAGLANAKKLEDSTAVVNGLLLLGRILLELGQKTSALQRTDEGLELARSSGLRLAEGAALDQSGELKFSLRQFEDALRDLDESRSIANSSGDVELLWRSEYHRGRTLERLRRDEEALGAYEAAVKVIESVRAQISQARFRTGYLQDKQRVYIALVRLLLRLGRAADAFEYSERLREYSYLNLRYAPTSMATTVEAEEARARLRRLQSAVDEETKKPFAQQRSEALRIYSEELVGAQREVEELESARGAPREASAFRVSSEKVREALQKQTALLEYIVDDDQLSIFVITSEGLHVVTESLEQRNLHSKIELLRDLVNDPAQQNWRRPAESLNESLIFTVERRGYLKGIRSLVIIPHGILNYLPFALLTDPARKSDKFLAQRYQLAEAPAASVLLVGSTKSGSTDHRVVAFAPAKSGLRYAIPEAQDVGRIFAPNSAVITGHSATESRFKAEASRYGIIHVVTHGFFNRVNPVFSGLQFEADAKNDGRLEVHEIVGLRLGAKLVTLSACDTALGSSDFDEIPAGDEFVGLNRAFLEAGSDAVLASLWKVNDRSTMTMMDRFYRHISHEGSARALAEAQRAMIRDPKYSHPYYWASFVFIGRDVGFSNLFAEKH